MLAPPEILNLLFPASCLCQVFLHPDSDVRDTDGGVLPPLIYVSREKRPGYDHNKKAGAMNALLRASGLITNVRRRNSPHHVVGDGVPENERNALLSLALTLPPEQHQTASMCCFRAPS